MTAHDKKSSEIFASLRCGQKTRNVLSSIIWMVSLHLQRNRQKNPGGFKSLRSLHSFIGVLQRVSWFPRPC